MARILIIAGDGSSTGHLDYAGSVCEKKDLM